MASRSKCSVDLKQRICHIENKLNTTKECFHEINERLLHLSLTQHFFSDETPDEFNQDFEQITTSFENIKREADLLASVKWNVIALGKNKTGKTSFINSLVGKNEFLPTSATTQSFKSLVGISASENDSLEICVNGNDEFAEITEENLHTLFCNGDNNLIHIHIPCFEHELLTNHVKIWDTPGLDRAENNEEAKKCKEKVKSICGEPFTVAVVLFDVGLSTMEPVIKNIKFALECGVPQERILVAVTEWDTVPDDEKEETEEEIRNQLEYVSKNLFFIDATNKKNCKGFSAIYQRLLALTKKNTKETTEQLEEDLATVGRQIENKKKTVHEMLITLKDLYTTPRQLISRVRDMMKDGFEEWKEFVRKKMEIYHDKLIDNVLSNYELKYSEKEYVRSSGLGSEDDDKTEMEGHGLRRRTVRVDNRDHDWNHDLLLEDGQNFSDPVIKALISLHSNELRKYINQEAWLSGTPEDIKELLKDKNIELKRSMLCLSQYKEPRPTEYTYQDKKDPFTYLSNPNVIRVGAVVSSLSVGLKIISSEVSRTVWIIGGALTAFVGLGGFVMGESVASHFSEKKISKKRIILKNFVKRKVENVLETLSVSGAESYIMGFLKPDEDNEKIERVLALTSLIEVFSEC